MRLFKNITIFFLLLPMLLQSFSTLVVMGHYEMNRRYYAEVLCENKNRPELACEGKCALMLKLNHYIEQKQESNNKSLENFLNQDFFWVLYENEKLNIEHNFALKTNDNRINFYLKTCLPQRHSEGLLRPPIG